MDEEPVQMGKQESLGMVVVASLILLFQLKSSGSSCKVSFYLFNVR